MGMELRREARARGTLLLLRLLDPSGPGVRKLFDFGIDPAHSSPSRGQMRALAQS